MLELEIIIDDSLGYTISVFGWLLTEDHELYLKHLRTVRNITVSDLVKEVESRFICPGVQQGELSSAVVSHTVPKYVDPLFDDQDTSGSIISTSAVLENMWMFCVIRGKG